MSGFPVGGIVAIVVGGVAVLVVIAIVIFCLIYKRSSVKLGHQQRSRSIKGKWIRRSGDEYDPRNFGSSFETRDMGDRDRPISYDRRYVHTEDKAVEADLRHSLYRRDTISNYGEVKIFSLGDRYHLPGGSQPDTHRHSGHLAPQGGSHFDQLLEPTNSKTQLLKEEPSYERNSRIMMSDYGYAVANRPQLQTPSAAYPVDDYPYATVDKRPVAGRPSSSVYHVELRNLATRPGVHRLPSTNGGSKHDSFRASAGVDLGAEPRRAWDTSHYGQQAGRRNLDFVSF
ncbi:uncharacterized protein LOC127878961 [Dreissena polymorpha]|uniref:Uncharacterized protein n=1 Tax=Dreissena polymorpha TaxID=45954 RepID=A0A9D4QT96_DREPO|nr:uncharacterized protein LOC127878961 [Dreissena polymorpha]KAH3841425.1 hypothetical protein DPMN_114888 [Dreissena polymorpha]